jgi:hypothetical protein
MVREEGVSALARGVGPNVFRAILMNSSQLASYDFFKAELLKTPYFSDNILCHFTASFAAVSYICVQFSVKQSFTQSKSYLYREPWPRLFVPRLM